MARLGVDIGGTFTDFALIDPPHPPRIHKQLTTPDDPARAVLDGVQRMTDGDAGRIHEIVHGTTLVTNALIERRGARTGMLVTEGFRDLFDIGREQRYDLYDLRLRFAEPLVPRALRHEIAERMRHDGSAMRAPDPEEVTRALRALADGQGIAALAVCFLHSHVNPAHEQAVRDIAARLYPDLPVSTSAGVFPYAREFERWTTTCANAYAQPMVDSYLARLEDGLRALGFRGRLAIIASSGGLITPDTARAFPVRLLESGPAAGVLMSARIGQARAQGNILSFDLGGTTAKGALVRGGAPARKYTFEAAHVHRHRTGSGLPLQIPVIDMIEIGAGGGSVVAIDELGLMRVGPRSAGAAPGPVCYGRGGTEPTLTDANLLLGYLDPAFFLGGEMALARDAARAAVARRLADPLDLSVERAAWGIHDIANADIARAFRMHATERGFDCRRSAIVALGGGGPLHAARIARKLRVPEVVFPAGAGVMSALGMLMGAMGFEIMRAFNCALDDLDADALDRVLAGIEAEAARYPRAAGLPASALRCDRRLDMRYRGQGYDIEVVLPEGLHGAALRAALPELFARHYAAVFHTTLDAALEIASIKVAVRGPEPPLAMPQASAAAAGGQAGGLKGHRRAFFPAAGGMVACPVYDRYALPPGARLSGPALVEEAESTCLLDAGDTAVVEDDGGLRASIAVPAGAALRQEPVT